MIKVRFYLTDVKFTLEKEFSVSAVPQAGWNVNVDGAVVRITGTPTLQVKEDIVQVHCRASLRMLCVLHFENEGWIVHEGADVFERDENVMKEVKAIKRMRSLKR